MFSRIARQIFINWDLGRRKSFDVNGGDFAYFEILHPPHCWEASPQFGKILFARCRAQVCAGQARLHQARPQFLFLCRAILNVSFHSFSVAS
jgi:hypothetical protein